jgi:hypothetical protein
LGLRNLNLGGDFLRLQNSQVHHFSGGTVVGGASRPNNDRHPTSIFRRIQAEQNQLYLAWISYPRILSCFWLPFWICLNLAGSLILVVRGEFKLSLSPWLGLRGFVRILRTAPASARRSRLQTKVIRRFGFVPSKLIVFFKLGVPTLKVR